MFIGNFSSMLSTKIDSGWKTKLANVSYQNECPWLKTSKRDFHSSDLYAQRDTLFACFFTHWHTILELSQDGSTAEMLQNPENVSNYKNFPRVCANLKELIIP